MHNITSLADVITQVTDSVFPLHTAAYAGCVELCSWASEHQLQLVACGEVVQIHCTELLI